MIFIKKTQEIFQKIKGNRQEKERIKKQNIEKNNKIKQEKQKEKKKKQSLEFSKKLVLFIVVNAELQIWASYVLGYLGKTQIAETLSTTVVKTVIYVAICYLTRALVEGLSKNTTMFGENLPFPNATSVDELIDDIDSKNNVDLLDSSLIGQQQAAEEAVSEEQQEESCG